MAINKEWHLKNKMPPKASLSQRIKWHRDHVKNCLCRPMPKKLMEEIGKQKSHLKGGIFDGAANGN